MPGEVPDGWSGTTLGNLFSWSSGKKPPFTIAPEGPIPVFGSNGILGFGSDANVTHAYLVGRVGASGSLHAVRASAWANDNTLVAVPSNGKADFDFLGFLLDAANLTSLATKTAQPLLTQSNLKPVPVLLPPLPEQKKIAAILSSVDEAVQATQRVIDQTRRVREGLLQDLLTRGLPGHTRFKQTEIGEIPDSWEVRRLDKISPSLSVGLVINPSTYFAEEGTVPMLVGSNIKENGIDWKSVRRISTASNETLRSTQIYEGDLVTVRVGNPGLTLVVPPELDGSNCASVMIIRKDEHFDSNWLCAALNSRQGTRQFAAVQYGTAQKQFNISHAVKFKFAVPPLAEQRAIAAITATMNEQAGVSEGALSQLHRVKRGLLQDLLTGKVRVSP